MAETSLEFVGTATTVLRLGPFTLLTDPNFLHRGQLAYLGKGLVSRRQTEPSLQPGDLPALDGVLLSHLHGDHFDRIARRELDRELPVFTTPKAGGKLQKWGFGAAHGMSTWETVELTEGQWRLRITSVPGVHGPGPVRFLMPPVMGTVLELQEGGGRVHRTYISGDTLCRPWLREVVDRLGRLDAAILHLGGTRVLGVLVTMDDRQGTDLAELLEPDVAVPIHYDDYGVFRSPLEDLVSTWQSHDLPTALRTVRRGETVSLRP